MVAVHTPRFSCAWALLKLDRRPPADSQTKCNTDDVWRERKKKGLEGAQERPEGGDEVSATEWGRTERVGSVALGGTEAGGDRARAWAPSQHGLARTEAQRGALRWLVLSAARSSEPTRGVIARGAIVSLGADTGSGWKRCWGRVEPRTSLRALELKRELAISHETIYRHIWRDLRSGGTLHQHLRGARKSCRKRYGRYDSRGRLAGKRMIGERPARVERRGQIGHWEIDTMMGESPGKSSHCVLTLVERKSGYLMLGKLPARTAAETNRALLGLLARHPGRMRTHHRGQRDRVPLVWPSGSGQPGQVLLRHPASQLGARDQREHQRTHPPVSAQRSNHGSSHPKRMRSNRPTPQQPTQEKTWLQNTQSMLPSLTSKCCTSKLSLGLRPWGIPIMRLAVAERG